MDTLSPATHLINEGELSLIFFGVKRDGSFAHQNSTGEEVASVIVDYSWERQGKVRLEESQGQITFHVSDEFFKMAVETIVAD